MAVSAQQVPVPRPFPEPGSSSRGEPARQAPQPPAQRPPAPAPATQPPRATAPVDTTAPSEAELGVPIYPGAQFLASYDAGRGQRYYLFGSTASYIDLVQYYRNVLKQKGEQVFDAPATQEFDVGRYREETMAFPPGVTIKDFQSDISQGYPNPKVGAQPARFPSIIQIVPVAPGS